MNKGIAWAFLIISIILGAFGQVFLKLAVESSISRGIEFYRQLAKTIWLYAGAVSYGFSFILWLAALRNFDVGFARPLTSIGYIITYIVAILVIGEPFFLRRVLGIVVITAGVILLK